jgi:hypothetical protein
MRTAANPFPRGPLIVCSGRLLGVLNRDRIQGPQLVDPTIRILVILPDNWEFVRQNTLAAHTPTPTSSNAVSGLPTTPRSAGPGGVTSRSFTSRNPFSSPSSGRRLLPRKKALPLTPTGPATSLNATTVDLDPVLIIPSSGMSRFLNAYGAAALTNYLFRYRLHGGRFRHRTIVGGSTCFQ